MPIVPALPAGVQGPADVFRRGVLDVNRGGGRCGGGKSLAFRRNRVISPMRMTGAAGSLFFDVCNFARAAHIAITSDDATAGQRGEPK